MKCNFFVGKPDTSSCDMRHDVLMAVTPRVYAITSARVISTHSHSRRLIILLATRLSSSFVVFPRSASSLPSNIVRRMSTTVLIQYEQCSLKNESLRVIRSGGPLATIQIQSQTSSVSHFRLQTEHCTAQLRHKLFENIKDSSAISEDSTTR